MAFHVNASAVLLYYAFVASQTSNECNVMAFYANMLHVIPQLRTKFINIYFVPCKFMFVHK
jgi:hypothetical protein